MLNKLRISKYSLWLILPLLCLFTILSYGHFSNNAQWSFNVSPKSPTIYPYLAVIIDDRADQKVINSVLNVLQHIPNDWKVQMFTHPASWSFYKQSVLSPYIESNRVFMTPINFARNNMSGDDFINLYLTSVSLWRQVQGEKVLYFQIDAAICSNSSYKLTDFLHYDFIGAPWRVGGCCNGGFSIRSRTKTLQLLESDVGRYPLRQIHEDGWFTKNLPRVGGIVAPIAVAKEFSVETIYFPRPFAVHKPLITYLGKTI